MSVLNKLKLDRVIFGLAYRRGMRTWDTGVPAPELVSMIEGPNAPAPGRALDLGSGTGTNSIYLARYGWHVTGVDFAAPAVDMSNRKLQDAGTLSGAVRFIRGDVTTLDTLPLDESYDLLFDQGCLHTIATEKRKDYAAGVARYASPGAPFLLYAFYPRRLGMAQVGITPDEVRALLEGSFTVERVEETTERDGIPSAWYWLRRKASGRGV